MQNAAEPLVSSAAFFVYFRTVFLIMAESNFAELICYVLLTYRNTH